MRRIVFAVALLLSVLHPATAVETCPPPRCLELAVPIFGDITVPDSHVRVILPAGYDSTTRSYPVFYLLHGASDAYTAWTERTDVLSLTSALDLIVVMPDGGKNSEAGWYSDWKDGSRQWETFHTKVLLEYIDANFRTLGDGHRAIAGLSMGGFGAMSYAARHPDDFEIAASFSGAVDIRYVQPLTGIAFTLAHDRFGTPDDRVWGNQITDEQTWREHNPTDLAANLSGVRLLIATGNGLPGGAHENLSNVGGYALENGVWQMNLSFIRALDAAGVAHTDLLYGPGDHSWPYWRDDLSWALPQIMDAVA